MPKTRSQNNLSGSDTEEFESDYEHEDEDEHEAGYQTASVGSIDSVKNSNNKGATLREHAAVFSLLFLIYAQIVTKKLDMFSPADGLNIAKNYAWNGFELMGTGFVTVSYEIAEYVSIKEVAFGIYDLFEPLGKLVLSPYNIGQGIYNAVIQNVNQSMIAIGTTVSLLVLFSVIAQRNLWKNLRPSAILNMLRKGFNAVYGYVGQYLAAVSAIYKVLKLDRFVEDLISITVPFVSILFVPFEIIRSYYRSIEQSEYFSVRKGQYVTGRGVIIAGSLTLISVFVYGYYLRHGIDTEAMLNAVKKVLIKTNR